MSGNSSSGIEHVDELEPGDRVEFEASGTSGIPSAVVTDSLIDPVFPPEADDQIPGSLSVALKNPETQTIWNFSEEIDPDTGLTGEIVVSVKACIDVRHPPRYRWRERGDLVSCEVVGRETSVIESTDSDHDGGGA